MSKKTIIIIIQTIFFICPILWLLFAVDYKSVISVLRSIDAPLIFFLFAVIFVRFVLQSLRFWLLTIPLCNGKIKLKELIALDWKARYYSIIMPSSAGQDITRAVLLKKHLSVSQIVALTVFFRTTGIITFIFIAIFGFFRLSSQEEIFAAAVSVGILFSIVCAAAIISFSEKAVQKILSLLPKKTPPKIIHFITSVSKSMQLYKKYPKLFAFNLFFALFLHLMFLVFPIVAIYAVCGEWRIIEVITFFPIMEFMAAAIPFLPNGAGAREVLTILFFEYIGAAKEQAFSYITLSVILYLMLFAGFFVVLSDKIKNKIPKRGNK